MNILSSLNIEILTSGDENSLFNERETQVHHSPYHWEQQLIGFIRDGNVKMVERSIVAAIKDGSKIGKYSDDELRQTKYMAVVFAHQASRAAIQGGMFETDAFNKRDAFIQKIDKVNSVAVVLESIQEAMRYWTKEMHEIRFYRNFTKPISICLEYIYNNLHSRISLRDLSKASCLSETYLSALFKKEVGINVTTYILQQKIKTAQEMLLRTSLSTKDIGFYLNYSSQSYFISCFKSICGVTPKQYRKRVNIMEPHFNAPISSENQ